MDDIAFALVLNLHQPEGNLGRPAGQRPVGSQRDPGYPDATLTSTTSSHSCQGTSLQRLPLVMRS